MAEMNAALSISSMLMMSWECWMLGFRYRSSFLLLALSLRKAF
jgi:hypothetical protein